MMATRLGEQLVHAFTHGSTGGNPSHVIATAGEFTELGVAGMRIAQERGCEVTHLHFSDRPGEARLRFHVSAGEITFCGHGALAAAAWAVATGRATESMRFDCQTGILQVGVAPGGMLGFIEQAGAWRALSVDEALRSGLAAMLSLADLPKDVRIVLGGKARAKAMVVLPDKDLMAALNVQPLLRDRFCLTHQVTGIYPMSELEDGTVMARHFPLHAGVTEDMATGNIAATVAAMLSGRHPRSITIAQGGPDCTAARLQVSFRPDGRWLVGGTCRIGEKTL